MTGAAPSMTRLPAMQWFGPDWGAPICRSAEHVEVPRGRKCALCGDGFDAADAGLLVPLAGSPNDPDRLPFHELCFLACVAPVVVHRLVAGMAACLFTSDPLERWPYPHRGTRRLAQVSCRACKEAWT